MDDRPLRFSERQRLAETGSLGELVHDSVPEAVRMALGHTLAEILRSDVGASFFNDLVGDCVEHFGWSSDRVSRAPFQADLLEFLDFVEIVAGQSARPRTYYMHAGPGAVFSGGRSSKQSSRPALRDFPDRFNRWSERHRFGYRFEAGTIRRVGSPALAQHIVGPALLAARRDGWDQVEQRFKEALLHQRGGPDENDDAITAAHAALEAALKAAGLRGDHIGPLAKSLRRSDLVPAQLDRVPELLDDLLQRSSAIRNVHGDAHGKRPGTPAVPQELVDLAVHWTGAFIVYLSEATSRR